MRDPNNLGTQFIITGAALGAMLGYYLINSTIKNEKKI